MIGGYGKALQEKIWELPENFYDKWIMREFKVLPNDEKLTSLFYEQKVMLFESMQSLPENKTLKMTHYLLRERDEIVNKSYKEFIPSGIMKNMEATFKLQGHSEQQIKDSFFKQAEQRRAIKLKEIDINLHKLTGVENENSKEDLLEKRKLKMKDIANKYNRKPKGK